MEGYMKLGVGVQRIGAELSPLSSSTAFNSTRAGSPKAWEQSALTLPATARKFPNQSRRVVVSSFNSKRYVVASIGDSRQINEFGIYSIRR
jgi:hypothetical protein